MSTTRRALLSVTNKKDVTKLGHRLSDLGFVLVSTGGTARALRDAGLTVVDVSEITGFPEMMDGRLKTLHPKIFGGILGRIPEDLAVMAEHGIHPFELVVVNLYAFAATAAQPGKAFHEVIEQVDVGGPSMIRAAVKNHAHIGIVTHPDQYEGVATELERDGHLSHASRRLLAVEAALMLKDDAAAVSDWLAEQPPPTD